MTDLDPTKALQLLTSSPQFQLATPEIKKQLLAIHDQKYGKYPSFGQVLRGEASWLPTIGSAAGMTAGALIGGPFTPVTMPAGGALGQLTGDLVKRGIGKLTGTGESLLPTGKEAGEDLFWGAVGGVPIGGVEAVAPGLSGLKAARGAATEETAKSTILGGAQAEAEQLLGMTPAEAQVMKEGGLSPKGVVESAKNLPSFGKEEGKQVRLRPALRDTKGKITAGGSRDTHGEIFRRMGEPSNITSQGYLDPDGNWLSRKEAMTREIPGKPNVISWEPPITPAAQLGESRRGVEALRSARIAQEGEKFNPIFEPIAQYQVHQDALATIASKATQAEKNALGQGYALQPKTLQQLDRLKNLVGGTLPTGKIILRQGGPVQAGQIRGWNAEIAQIARSSPRAIDRKVLYQASESLREVLDSFIPEEKKPLLQSLKDEYHRIQNMVPYKGVQQLDKASTMTEMGEILADPKRANGTVELWKMANPEKREMMKEMIASHLWTKYKTPEKIAQAVKERYGLIRNVFGDSLLSHAEGWSQLTKLQDKLIDSIKNPSASIQWDRTYLKSLQQEASRRAGGPTNLANLEQKAVVAALQEHVQMGGMGRYVQHRVQYDLMRMGEVAGAASVGTAGLITHNVPMMAGVGTYLLTRAALSKAMANPATAHLYRRMLFSPSVRGAATIAGRLVAASLAGHQVTPSLAQAQPSPVPKPPSGPLVDEITSMEHAPSHEALFKAFKSFNSSSLKSGNKKRWDAYPLEVQAQLKQRLNVLRKKLAGEEIKRATEKKDLPSRTTP